VEVEVEPGDEEVEGEREEAEAVVLGGLDCVAGLVLNRGR